MTFEFTRHKPIEDRIILLLTLDNKKMKERILIGEEQEIRSRLEGKETTGLLYDATRPLGTFLIQFVSDERGEWNMNGVMPLYNALHTNRWKQPALEQAASEFLSAQYASGDPVKMYVAFQIWNNYLVTREYRDRDPASENFVREMTRLMLAFRTENPLEYDKETGEPVRFDVTLRRFASIPSEETTLSLWYPDNRRRVECVSMYGSFYPVITYYMNRMSDWKLCFRQCKICGKVFIAPSLRYELCSEKCRKKQSLQNKRDFDERARENNYDRVYKNECQHWRNLINKYKKQADFSQEKLSMMEQAFTKFKREALARKKLVKEKKTSSREFESWIFSQYAILQGFVDAE